MLLERLKGVLSSLDVLQTITETSNHPCWRCYSSIMFLQRLQTLHVFHTCSAWSCSHLWKAQFWYLMVNADQTPQGLLHDGSSPAIHIKEEAICEHNIQTDRGQEGTVLLSDMSNMSTSSKKGRNRPTIIITAQATHLHHWWSAWLICKTNYLHLKGWKISNIF